MTVDTGGRVHREGEPPWTTMDSMQLTFNPWVEGSNPSRLTLTHSRETPIHADSSDWFSAGCVNSASTAGSNTSCRIVPSFFVASRC